jgi:hypothetical protein
MALRTAQPQNLIFWGAGATRELGIRTTVQQEAFILCITDANGSGKPLEKRVSEALGEDVAPKWHAALYDLIMILGDTEDSYSGIDNITPEQVDAMCRNWGNTDENELRRRIIGLRLIYDWPALKSLARVCPGSKTKNFKLNDLFNLLDMHISPGFGVRAPAPYSSFVGGEQFFDSRRLIGAKNALLMILITSFYIDYRVCIHSRKEVLEQYYQFAQVLGRRMQRQGVQFSASGTRFDQPAFYHADVAFVSLNYDPIALWLQFVANRNLNRDPLVPVVGTPPVPLHLFHDFGHLIPARRIGQPEDDWPWFPLNEAAAQRLNELTNGKDPKVRLTKFLFPHGCLCWRECPDCGKLSAYHGDTWDREAEGLFPPPPLRMFDDSNCVPWITGSERAQREAGKVDARKCLHCGTVTFAQHTQAVMQSSFKPRPPSFIEEIQRELRATTMQASHIIFMGYSLPPDDVTYRAFFSARRQRAGRPPVRCTVINKDSKNPGWYGPADLNSREFPDSSPVWAAFDIFGEENVRYYGGGIPQVFLDGDKATDEKLEQLLTWEIIS